MSFTFALPGFFQYILQPFKELSALSPPANKNTLLPLDRFPIKNPVLMHDHSAVYKDGSVRVALRSHGKPDVFYIHLGYQEHDAAIVREFTKERDFLAAYEKGRLRQDQDAHFRVSPPGPGDSGTAAQLLVALTKIPGHNPVVTKAIEWIEHNWDLSPHVTPVEVDRWRAEEYAKNLPAEVAFGDKHVALLRGQPIEGSGLLRGGEFPCSQLAVQTPTGYCVLFDLSRDGLETLVFGSRAALDQAMQLPEGASKRDYALRADLRYSFGGTMHASIVAWLNTHASSSADLTIRSAARNVAAAMNAETKGG